MEKINLSEEIIINESLILDKEINLNKEIIIHESLILDKILHKLINDYYSYRVYNCDNEELINVCKKHDCRKYFLILLENNINVEINIYLYPELFIQILSKINYNMSTFVVWLCVLNKKYYIKISPADNNNDFQFSIFNIINNHCLCSGFITTKKIEILPYIKIEKFNFAFQYGYISIASSLINILKKKMNKYYLSYLESYQLLKNL